VGVVTTTGSSVCHGANLLREHRHATGREVSWVTGVPRPCWPRPYTLCSIDAARGLLFENLECASVRGARSASTGAEAVVAREIVSLNVDRTSQHRCYWPHRSYDVLSASLMIPGLSASASALAQKPVSVVHGTDGLLWFTSSSPTIMDLVAIATDPIASRPHLDSQRLAYDAILREVRHDDINCSTRDASAAREHLHRLVDLITLYFSNFLLHHDTYEHVILKLVDTLHGDRISVAAMDQVITLVTTPGIIRWQREHDVILTKKKDVLEEIPPVRVPSVDVSEDLAATLRQSRAGAGCLGVGSTRATSFAAFATEVMVLKEWKFVMNKILLSRFSSAARRLGLPVEGMRRLTMSELLSD
jgi:hypothetical protein